jgi:hypothetical protein
VSTRLAPAKSGDVALDAADLLACVIPLGIDVRAAFFRAFDALAVDDTGRRTGLAVRCLAALLVELEFDPPPRSVVLPALEIPVQRASRRQILGDAAPLTTSTEHVHDAVEDLPRIDLATPAATLGRWDHALDERPLLVGRVTGVT